MKQAAIAIMVLMLAATTQAASVQWTVESGGNGHWYEAVAVPAGLDWQAADSAAAAKGGYLASITSEAENNFVFSLIDDEQFWRSGGPGAYYRGPWIGGALNAGITPPIDPLEDWEWTTGEAFDYENWRTSSGEPGGDGDRIHFADSPEWVRSAEWNDLPGTFLLNGYVVEVPEPATMSLLAIGGIAFLKRRNK